MNKHGLHFWITQLNQMLWKRGLIGHPKSREQVINFLLRLSSLASKLLLTLFMGRYYDLSSMGIYGLVFSAVVFSGALAGQSLNYVVMREVVDIPQIEALRKVRDQAIWYILNYIVLGFVLAGLCFWDVIDISPVYFLYVLVISMSEGLGSIFYYNMNSFNQQLYANISLFVRAALWVPVVIVLGFIDDRFLSAHTVLVCWCIGSIAALSIPLAVWGRWKWREAMAQQVDWKWLLHGVRKSSFVWLGTLSAIIGGYIDRYVVNHYLNLDYVGIMTFYYSFVNAFFPLIESGILSYVSPRLVLFHKRQEMENFWQEVKGAFYQVSVASGVLVFILSWGVPVLALLLGRDAIMREMPTFWLLLGATWFDVMSLCLSNILYAQHRDTPLWVGNLVCLVPVVISNFVFISNFGFIGIAYAALVGSFCHILWRYKAIKWPQDFSFIAKNKSSMQ